MKARVIQKGKKFIPQIKTWYSFGWRNLHGSYDAFSDFIIDADTLEIARSYIDDLKKPNIIKTTVVWEQNL